MGQLYILFSLGAFGFGMLIFSAIVTPSNARDANRIRILRHLAFAVCILCVFLSCDGLALVMPLGLCIWGIIETEKIHRAYDFDSEKSDSGSHQDS